MHAHAGVSANESPSRPPEIETARLRLYPPRPEDLEARLAMDRDPEVMRFTRPVPEDAKAQRAQIRAALDGPPGRGAFWHVEERAAPGFIGWCGLFPLEDSGLIELGYRYLRAAWGRGFATEAATAALDHGFRELNFIPSSRSAIRTTPRPTGCCARPACAPPAPQDTTDANYRSSN